jgi:uncharacterized protein YuzE
MATVKNKTKHKEELPLADVRAASRALAKLPWDKLDCFYDREADVLYISIDGPPRAETTSELLDEDDVFVGYKGGKIISITIIDASLR